MTEHNNRSEPPEFSHQEELQNLIINRKAEEGVVIDHTTTVRLLNVDSGRKRVTFGIIAPNDVMVLRKEVTESESEAMKFMKAYNRRKQENRNRPDIQIPGLLILTRKTGQSILIGSKACFTVLKIGKLGRVKLEFLAVKSVSIKLLEKEEKNLQDSVTHQINSEVE